MPHPADAALAPAGRAWWLRSAILAAVLAAVAAGGLLPGAATSHAAEPAKRLNFFHSSHSETDDPFADHLAAVLRGRGYGVDWNQQIIIGSPISWRIFADKPRTAFAGYRMGKNRNGAQGLDVVGELARAGHYDVLLLAEGHNTVAVLRWHETHRMIRQFHDRHVDGNPKGTTYLIEPWESIKDKSEPEPWVALEGEATKLWGCVVDRVNLGLAHEGRKDRVVALPLAASLAHLVGRAAVGSVPGLSASSRKATMDLLFQDDVHLAPLGRYYIVLVTFAALTGEPAVGAWRPAQVTAAQAEALQRVADEFLAQRKASYTQPNLAACRRLMADSFCARWNAYVPSKWVSRSNDCAEFFSSQSHATERFQSRTPFHFDPATEKGYWLPRP